MGGVVATTARCDPRPFPVVRNVPCKTCPFPVGEYNQCVCDTMSMFHELPCAVMLTHERDDFLPAAHKVYHQCLQLQTLRAEAMQHANGVAADAFWADVYKCPAVLANPDPRANKFLHAKCAMLERHKQDMLQYADTSAAFWKDKCPAILADTYAGAGKFEYMACLTLARHRRDMLAYVAKHGVH